MPFVIDDTILWGSALFGVVSATSAWFMRKEIFSFLIGKNLVILGERATGKTTLFNALHTHLKIPTASFDYSPTGSAIKEKHIRFRQGDDWITIKTLYDVSGSGDERETWRSLFNDSSHVFYLVKADKLFAKDPKTVNRVKEDLELISSWDEEHRKSLLSPGKKVVIVGNFFKDPSNPEKYDAFKSKKSFQSDDFEKLEPLCKQGIWMRKSLGSLLEHKDQIELIKESFKKLKGQ